MNEMLDEPATITQMVVKFFREHPRRSFATRDVVRKLETDMRMTNSTIHRLFSLAFLKRTVRNGIYRYRLADQETPSDAMKRTPVEDMNFSPLQIEILRFVASRRGQSFSCADIVEEFCIPKTHVIATMGRMSGFGLLDRICGVYPFRYEIADDERIAVLFRKAERNEPLSPFWMGMQVWDSAVRAAIGARA